VNPLSEAFLDGMKRRLPVAEMDLRLAVCLSEFVDQVELNLVG